VPCLFTVSRRGRIRGSKNRRTLEKLGAEAVLPPLTGVEHQDPGGSCVDVCRLPQSLPAHGEDIDQSSAMVESCSDSSSSNNEENRVGGGPCRVSLDTELPRSGTATPWNPRNIVLNGKRQKPRPSLAKDLSRILGEFPIHHGDRSSNVEESDEVMEPMWLMAGLAERGWALQSAEESSGGAHRPHSLTSTILPDEETLLLRQWTPDALRRIEREQTHYFQHGALGSKCDVSDDLDPVQHGLITEDRAGELYDMCVRACIKVVFQSLTTTLVTGPRSIRSGRCLIRTCILQLI